MNKKLNRVAELAIIRSVPEICLGKLKGGRLKNLYGRLQREADIELSKVRHVSNMELKAIGEVLDTFVQNAGWENKGKHVATLLSFCLAMIENSEFDHSPKITDILAEVYAYMEKGGRTPAPCNWAGDHAAMRWKEAIGECSAN